MIASESSWMRRSAQRFLLVNSNVADGIWDELCDEAAFGCDDR